METEEGPRAHTYLPLIAGDTADSEQPHRRYLDEQKPCKAQVEVLKEGTSSDHAPLLVTLQTQSTGLYIPTQTEPRRAEPTTRLVLPISVADRPSPTGSGALTEARFPRSTHYTSISRTSKHACDTHLRAIEAQDGKASARLTLISTERQPRLWSQERPTSFRISYRQHTKQPWAHAPPPALTQINSLSEEERCTQTRETHQSFRHSKTHAQSHTNTRGKRAAYRRRHAVPR
jgi:hypothetical protein